ncbi:MAG: FimV/HubP family polar landmark protein [Halofilum sp. (in: g-proteobacteria)]|nr:FimV/HubP family polar landmark protein [Halofilum sp. (in: g-proteobacteria)]
MALTLALSLAAGPAAAAGLGRIELDSGLNERLDARIPLYNAGQYPSDAIEVGLASAERFRAAELERPHALTALRFELEPAASGDGHVIRVRSPDVIVEPFLSFLVAVDLPDGRLVRAYTVLLDPPSFAGDSGTAQPATAVAADTPAQGASLEATGGAAAMASPAATVTAPAATPDRYGPVPRGSSAWRVAERVQPPGVSIYQTMVALRRANPGAFRDGDLGQLRAGVWLDVPTAAEIAAIPQARAVGIYRQYLADNGGAATATSPDTESSAGGGTATTASAAAPDGERAGAASPPSESTPATAATADAVATADAAATNTSATSAGGGMTAAGDVDRAPAPGPRLEQVRTDIAGLEATIAGLRARVDGGLTDQAEGIEQLRAALASVRGELVTLRESRAEPAPVGGTPLWVTGLIALLAAGLGGLFGFARGRRAGSSEAPGAATAMAAPAPDARDDREWPAPVAGEQGPDAEERPVVAAAEPAPQSETDGDDAALADAEPEFETGPEPADVPEPEPEPAPEAGRGTRATDWIDPEGVTAEEPDSYQSLADLCLEAGWARDAEGVLRDAIEQRGDGPAYRAGILAALHHQGAAETFREEFDRYRAVAADDDPAWTSVLQMGRELLPGDPAFGDAASAGATPAADEAVDAELELDDFEHDPASDELDEFAAASDPAELDDLADALEPAELEDLESADAPARETGADAAGEPVSATALPSGDEPPAANADEGARPERQPEAFGDEADGEPEFELPLDPEAEPRGAATGEPDEEEWPELDLDDEATAGGDSPDAVEAPAAGPEPRAGSEPVPFPGAAADVPGGDPDDPAAPLPRLDTGAGDDAGAGQSAPGPAEAEGDAGADGDFNLSLARVYLKAGWARDAEAVLREAIAQRGDEPAYHACLLEALFQAEARNEFLEAFDDYRAIAADDDPDWDEVRRMGRSLWPTHEAFADPRPGTEPPTAATDAAPGEEDAPAEADAELPRKWRRA